jgi:SWI/SNF-related matrix-associated actin-dependent regulator 1 of chromatin subfamily A
MQSPTPFPFQTDGIRRITAFGGRALLADEMGLGKTLQALWWLRETPAAWPAIVVCPASVKGVWEYETQRLLNIATETVNGQRPSPLPTRLLTIINYDILKHWLPHLQALRPATVILDEAHYCQNRQAQRTKAVQALCKGVPHVLALTGTPIINRPAEVWPVLNILQPKQFRRFWPFGQRYCDPYLSPWGWQFRGASNVRELNELLTTTCMIRRHKTDVLQDLPAKMRCVVPVPIERQDEYDEAHDEFLAWLQKISPDRARRAARAEAITRIGYLKQLAAKLKLRSVVEWINNWLSESNEKLVVFGIHTKMIEALQRRCNATSVVVDGGVTGEQRTRVIQQFQEEATRLFIGNVQAAGVGITLTAASTAVFTELPWRPGDLTQAEDRIHRIGQRTTAWAYYLVANSTIERHLCEVLQRKQAVIDGVLDGVEQSSEFSVFDELLGKLL